jgi:hypothetical protein
MEVKYMGIRDDIKAIIIRSGWTMTELVESLNEKYERNDTIQNISQKLSRETIKYREVLEIADILGYEIKWVKKPAGEEENHGR